MSFLYPRTISISRPETASWVGAMSYSSAISETQIAKGVPASIQVSGTGKRNDANLPADALDHVWRIYFKLALGTVKARDVITDDQGVRYQVSAPYWNSLGYAVIAKQLES